MKYLFFAAIALLVLQSCKEVVATNIEGQTPVLILPQEMDTVTSNPVHFKWEPIEGATKYRLQIASPSFDNISEYVLDSMITGTDFYLNMDTLQYELKLTAVNSGYESNTLGPIKFWVGTISTDPAEDGEVELTTPDDNAYKNDDFNTPGNGIFTWTGPSTGSTYKFELVKGASFGSGQPVYSTNASLSFQATLPGTVTLTEGQYFWGVRQYVGTDEQPIVTRTFFVDTTPPLTALLDLPAVSAVVSAGSVTFTWHFTQTNEPFPAPVNSIIEVATDQNFTGTSIIRTYTGPVYTHDFTLPIGTYYWRVRNEDEAGNEAAISDVRPLTVN